MVWCLGSLGWTGGWVGCDVVVVTDLPEVFISDGVVVLSGNWEVVRGFVVAVVFSPSVVGGSFSSVDLAADDVVVFMVRGWDDVIKSAIWDEEKIRADITIFISLKEVGIRVWDDLKFFIDLDDVTILVFSNGVLVFSSEEVWDENKVISLLTCDDVIICVGVTIRDDVMVFFDCSDVISSKCLCSVVVLTGVDLIAFDDASNRDDDIDFASDGEVISSAFCDERERLVSAATTAVDTRDVDSFDGVLVSVSWDVAVSSICCNELSSLEGLEDVFTDAESRAPDDVGGFTNWEDIIIFVGSDVISFNPNDEGSILKVVVAWTASKGIFSFSSSNVVWVEGVVTSWDDAISSGAREMKICFDEDSLSFDAAGFTVREGVSFTLMTGDDSICNALRDDSFSVVWEDKGRFIGDEVDITAFADWEELFSSSLMIEDVVISKTFNVVISSLVSEEKISSRREDDSISVNRELVNSLLVCDKKICFSWDDSTVDVVSCLLSKGEASIFKGSDDRITSLIEDSVEGVVSSLGVSTCWTSSVALCDVISPIGDEVATGCDVLISDSVDLSSFGKHLSKRVTELPVSEPVEWLVVSSISCTWIVVVIALTLVVEADFILNLAALFPTIETSAVIVLSVLISMVRGCEADGCVVPRYSGTVDSDPINSDRKLEIQNEKRPFKQERFFENLFSFYSFAHFKKDRLCNCIIHVVLKTSNFYFTGFHYCTVKFVNLSN